MGNSDLLTSPALFRLSRGIVALRLIFRSGPFVLPTGEEFRFADLSHAFRLSRGVAPMLMFPSGPILLPTGEEFRFV